LVSLGPRPPAFVMPELAGLQFAEAESKLNASGLRVAKLTPVAAPQAPSGSVVGQSPARGQRVDSTTKIELQIAQSQ
ncbi:MAG TPA: PASTA domain-containing protein, partial [Tepidisphaeraceae bacterium]